MGVLTTTPTSRRQGREGGEAELRSRIGGEKKARESAETKQAAAASSGRHKQHAHVPSLARTSTGGPRTAASCWAVCLRR